jgi:hypothetical protein
MSSGLGNISFAVFRKIAVATVQVQSPHFFGLRPVWAKRRFLEIIQEDFNVRSYAQS